MPIKSLDRPRIFLNKVHLKGFKSIEDLSIDFQKGLNILIGKNGSGKSNFLEIVFQSAGFDRGEKLSFNYAKLEIVADDDHAFGLELEKELRTKILKNDIDERNGLIERYFIDGEMVQDNSSKIYSGKEIEFKDKKIFFIGSFKGLFNFLGYEYLSPLFIKFDPPDNLECISTAGSLKINVEQQFTNWEYPNTLSFVLNLFFWKLEFFYQESNSIKDIVKAEIFERLQIPDNIIENLKFYTSIEDVRFSDNINIYNEEKFILIDNIKIEFKINSSWLPWSQLSDGTKRLFYIIAEVTNANGLVLIEEPELGIHPHQFNLLMDFLKEQSKDKQIIISTHSPKALDHLSPDELNNILITYYDLKKGTQIRHLTRNEITKAKKYMKEVGFFSDYWLLSDLEE